MKNTLVGNIEGECNYESSKKIKHTTDHTVFRIGTRHEFALPQPKGFTVALFDFVNYKDLLERIELEVIRQMLILNSGNIKNTAKTLGYTREAIRKKLFNHVRRKI